MPSAHWLDFGFDDGFLGGFYTRSMDVAVPATATVKRFMTQNTFVGVDYVDSNSAHINALRWSEEVRIVAGQYSPRLVYRSSRGIPMTIGTMYDVTVGNRAWRQWMNAGDNELGVNQKCSYGTADGPGMTWRFTITITKRAGALAFPDGDVIAGHRLLYVLP